jgi:hypothetical protein
VEESPPDDASPSKPAATLAGDLAKMQGTWKVVKFQIGSGNFPTPGVGV